MPRKNPRRNITRVLIQGTRLEPHSGWQVRLQRNGERHTAYFADRQFGGNRGALQAAKSYRDQMESLLHEATASRRARDHSPRNTSGTIGVQLEIRPVLEHPRESRRSWRAQWTDGRGRRRTRSFSVDKYGEKRARQLAVRARRDALT